MRLSVTIIKPRPHAWITAANGTEYFLSGNSFNSGTQHSITAWALSGTATLASAHPSLTLGAVSLNSETYGVPGQLTQPNGPIPQGSSVFGIGRFNRRKITIRFFLCGAYRDIAEPPFLQSPWSKLDPRPVHGGIEYVDVSTSLFIEAGSNGKARD